MNKKEYLETMVKHHQQILQQVLASGNSSLAKDVKSQLDYYLKELYKLERQSLKQQATEKLVVVFKELDWNEELLEDSVDYVIESLEDFDMTLEQVIEMWVENTKDNYSEIYKN